MEHQIEYKDISGGAAEGIRALYKSREEELDSYIEKLLWWNKRINLVSRDVSRETIKKHVEHSLVISGSGLFDVALEVVDAGTGGGLPGIPLSILYPDKKFILNDVVSKKIIACKRMAEELRLKNIKGISKSIRDVSFDGQATIVSKHAFKINDLYSMTQKTSCKGLVLLKGMDEIELELKGIQDALEVRVWVLEPGFKDPFYEGKAMVEIKKKETNE